jgi:two-component system OmpR family response regulator
LADEGPTILIVDDDGAAVRPYARLLTIEGYSVAVAANGASALEHVDSADAMFVDLQMPELNGAEFLRRVRETRPHVPVTVITGHYFLDEPTERELRALGAEIAYKPIWVDEFMAMAAKMLGRPADRTTGIRGAPSMGG